MPRHNHSSDSPDPIDVYVGLRVRERRVKLGYNQSELGRALGLTFQQVQKYEKGVNRISASMLYRTAGFLQMDMRDFFADLPDPKRLHEMTTVLERLVELEKGDVGKTTSFAYTVVAVADVERLCALVSTRDWWEIASYEKSQVVKKIA